jgi:hypothetical protein
VSTAARPALVVADLLASVRGHGTAVEGADLVFAADPPAELAAVLAVANTGIRALLAGRSWLGCGSSRRAAAAPRGLTPGRPIPADVTLLCVEGDERWDRIGADARLDLPALFGE